MATPDNTIDVDHGPASAALPVDGPHPSPLLAVPGEGVGGGLRPAYPPDWHDPPREFSLMPFWFWNDTLSEAGLLRQVAEFDANGVYGFVIHPRVGLPRDCGWMSDNLLGFYAVAIEEAERRDMRVLLYDEGMYPSGSSGGQVVARHPDLACRGLALHDSADVLPDDAVVLHAFTDADGRSKNVVDRRIDSVIRGLHYVGDGPAEDEPPAGDILNPRTVAAVLELVHDQFFARFGRHFGKTILGVFTDEPGPLGRCREKGVFPGTTGLLPHVNRLLGYDFAPHLPALWQTGDDADRYRNDYRRAVRLRLEETWYKPLSDWCEAHGVALCGHPDAGDEIGVQRHFHIPGQDLVWRWVAPDSPTATEGPESTQAKCTASAMVHHGRRRNSNEFAGAYGHETTWAEVRWLADWCLVRGVNLLIPHAFYYSVRGLRRDERPPQLGPHTPQWNDAGPNGFKAFADHCRRLCWLNTDSTPLVDVAVLTHDDRCPWRAAKALLERQIDFHYLDPATLLANGVVDADGLTVGPCRYAALVIDGPESIGTVLRDRIAPLDAAGRVVRFQVHDVDGGDPDDALAGLSARLARPIQCPADRSIRVRRVLKAGTIWSVVFDESLRRGAALRVTVERSNG